MPLVTVNYDTAKVSETVMDQVVKILVEGLAKALTSSNDQDGKVVPKGVRVFVNERSLLDYSAWDIDITVMTNDLPGRHNLQERLSPVSQSLQSLLEEQAPGVTHCLWANLHGPFAFFDPTERLS